MVEQSCGRKISGGALPHLAEQEAVDGQAGQLGHLPGLAVAPPGLQGLNGGEELLLLDGGGSALQQTGGQGHAGALQQLAELAELPEVWACTEEETHARCGLTQFLEEPPRR